MTDTTTIYSHPDGHEIAVGNGLLTACTSEGTALSIPIGPDGLAALGTALLECATEAQHGQASERAGAALGADLLQELLALRSRPQAEAFRAVRDRLHALTYMGHADSAAAGFAGAIVNVLEVGIANLPKTEGQQQ